MGRDRFLTAAVPIKTRCLGSIFEVVALAVDCGPPTRSSRQPS